MRILKDIYIWLVLAFYSTFTPTDEDNISLRSIVKSFELQVLPLDIAQIINTPDDGIFCRARERWLEEVGASEVEVPGILTGKRSMQVRDIHTFHLLTFVRVVYSMVQHTVLPRSGNTDVMTTMDHMVMFCLMTKKRINLVRLIMDFILLVVHVKRIRHATLPYDMFLTRVFIRA